MLVRNMVAVILLGLIIVLAWGLAVGWYVWWLAPVYWLGRYQLFHIVAHFSIFAGVVFLYRPQKHGNIRLWVFIVSGSVLIEMVQIAAGNFALTRPLLLDSLFDIGVDVTGAVVCWLILTLHHHRKLLSY